jgi:hypothetical protein
VTRGALIMARETYLYFSTAFGVSAEELPTLGNIYRIVNGPLTKSPKVHLVASQKIRSGTPMQRLAA